MTNHHTELLFLRTCRICGASEVYAGFSPDCLAPVLPERGRHRGQPSPAVRCGSPGCQRLWRSPGHQEGPVPIRSLAQSRHPHADVFVGSPWNLCIHGCHTCVGPCARLSFKVKGNKEANQHTGSEWETKRGTLPLFPRTTSLMKFSLQQSHDASNR